MEPGKYYHVYSHANGTENLFKSEDNYRYFLKRYQEFILPVADTYVYCLMPNHFHFLVKVKTEPELEEVLRIRFTEKPRKDPSKIITLDAFVIQQFSHLLNAYTQAINGMYDRKGSLFMHPFQRKEITDDDYLTSVVIYIHNNPVHHGFARELDRWKWSSYNVILSEEESFLKKDEVIKWFGNKEEYLKRHSAPLQPFEDFETLEGFKRK